MHFVKLSILSSLGLFASIVSAQQKISPISVSASRVDVSAPLAQHAASARIHGFAQPREINPHGMPALPKSATSSADSPEWADPLVREPLAPLVPAPAPFMSFDGLSNVNGVSPPDTQGDVGRKHYVQWVNLSLQIFDKSTGATVLGPIPGNSLWSGFGGPCE